MALQGTMTIIQTVTVGAGGAASIVFNNIPQTYSDLLIKISARLTFNAQTASLGVFLNTASTDTSYRWLRGNGSVTASGNDAAQNDFYPGEVNAVLSTSSVFSNYDVYIPNYTSSTQKSLIAEGVSENNATLAYQYFSTGLCTKTAAITSVTVRAFGGAADLVQHSTATLYGIARTTAKAIGGIISEDNTFIYHTFTSSGTFTPSQALSCDVLVIGGGGGASGGVNGVNFGSGAASGILRSSSAVSMGSGVNFTVTVGGGGAGAIGTGAGGSSSVLSGTGISTITATAGNGIGTGRTGASNADFSGGTGVNGFEGGGGAGTAGSGSGPTGGAASTAFSTWLSATGTGVNGAIGGGGASQNGTTTGGGGTFLGNSGTANTGSGGAGASSTSPGGNGGSGIVIVRYSK